MTFLTQQHNLIAFYRKIMTALIAIDDISDELPPAFMILDDESRQNIKVEPQ